MGPASKWHFVPKLGLLRLWGPITLYADLWLIWGLNQSCSLHQKISNCMSHVTCTQGNRGNSRLLMVKNQIVNLTPSPSFDHNLCLRCRNGSCKPISDIHIPRAFQWYKGCFNLMNFDPYNHFLKIQKSIGALIPKVGAHLGVWGFIPSHSPTFPGAWDVISGLPLGPQPCKPSLWLWAQG